MLHPSKRALGLASLLVLVPFLRAPDEARAAVARPAEPVELALKPYAVGLFTVEGRIGELRAPFLFDSGGGSTVLSPATAAATGCTLFGRGTGFRHDGQRVDGQRGTPVDLALGAFTRRGEVGVLDLDALLGGPPPV